ncbi:MAG: hypothetical protein ACTSQ7_13480 [Alphaproteobacteria bacterium]
MSSSGNRRDIGDELESPLGPIMPEEHAGAEVLILDSGELENPVIGEPMVGETVLLELADLLPDASGEVVLFAGADLPVNIVTDQPITEAGIAEAHVTATGVDVTGLHFYSFESGLTVYSPTDVLIVADSGAT